MLGAQGETVTPTPPGALGSTDRIGVTPRPRRRGGGKAAELVDQAISRIMDWNDEHAHDFDSLWFISVPAILALIRGSGGSASQGSVQETMARRKDEISQHHAAQGLGQRHNARHSHTITDDVRL
jgi:hypothetical protein